MVGATTREERRSPDGRGAVGHMKKSVPRCALQAAQEDWLPVSLWEGEHLLESGPGYTGSGQAVSGHCASA